MIFKNPSIRCARSSKIETESMLEKLSREECIREQANSTTTTARQNVGTRTKWLWLLDVARNRERADDSRRYTTQPTTTTNNCQQPQATTQQQREITNYQFTNFLKFEKLIQTNVQTANGINQLNLN